jgi:hypothetical protein
MHDSAAALPHTGGHGKDEIPVDGAYPFLKDISQQEKERDDHKGSEKKDQPLEKMVFDHTF